MAETLERMPRWFDGNDIKKLTALLGRCSYNEPNKREFRRLGTKLARALRTGLQCNASQMTVSFNAGGIAVSGDVTLRSTDGAIGGIYLSFNADCIASGLGIMYRHCSPDNPYGASTSTPNHWYTWHDLARHGFAGLLGTLQCFTRQKCIPRNMQCTGHDIYTGSVPDTEPTGTQTTTP